MTAGTGGIGGLPPVSPGVCAPTQDDCAISHASTGWCLAATGQPVIVITRIPCEGDADPTIQMVLASTGAVVPTQQVVPCAGNDWEIEQLCDFDENGEVIAVVTQIFQWNEATGELTVRLVRADDPDGPPYVPQGNLRQCAVPTWVDVETALVCGNTAGVFRQLTELIVWDTRNGSILASLYLDAEGNTVAPNPGETFTVGDCFTPALPSILDELEEANGNLADANTLSTAANALLTQIRDNADQVEPLLTALGANTDQIEPLLIQIRDNADGVEPALAATNALLTQIRDNADAVEPLLTALGANTDQLEPLVTATNALLTTIAGAVKNEDAVPGAGDAGIPALARRNDTGATTTSADGDYSHIATDGAGRVGVTPLAGTAPFPISGNVEIANDVGNPIPVSGTVAVSNFPASVEVSNDVGNPLPVTGPLTDVQLRATPVPVTDAALATTNTHLSNIAGYTDGIEGLLTAITGQLTTTNSTLSSILTRLSTSALLPPGQIVVGAAAAQMHPAGQAVQQGVIVQAHPNNTGIVYVGNSNAVTAANGFPLAAGASVTLPIPNTNQVWLIGSAAGQTAAWIEV